MSTDVLDAPAWLQCNGKERYSTPQIAARIAKRRNTNKKLRLKQPSRPLQPYRCIHCGFFHIGGKPK